RGIRWASTDMGGLIQLQRPLLEVVTQAEGLSDDNLYTVLDDREGRMWFGTRTSGVQFRLPDPHAPIRRLEEMQNGSVTDLFEDQAGRIWVATVGNGLVRLSDEQVEWHATTANGLSNDFVRAIAE